MHTERQISKDWERETDMKMGTQKVWERQIQIIDKDIDWQTVRGWQRQTERQRVFGMGERYKGKE